jgi:FKBP12-rapamycin complex-associated protein
MYLLSDENFDIREEALKILARLAVLNPAEVLPGFRQMLLNLISEIRNSADNRFREESVLMLCNFLRAPSLQRVAKVFMSTIIYSLPFTMDVRLTTASLQAIGELSVVMRQDILPFSDHLLPIIVLSMQDQSSRRKQEIAIKTMGQFVSATGLVVVPYLQYPQLLPSALTLVTKHGQNTPWSLRREALRTIGLLGALEPYKFTIVLEHLNVQRRKDRTVSAEIQNLVANDSLRYKSKPQAAIDDELIHASSLISVVMYCMYCICAHHT